MTCTRPLLLVLVIAGCLDPDTDLSTSTIVEVTGDSSSSSSEGTGSSSCSGDNTTSGTTGLVACDNDPACGPGEDLESCPSQCSVCGDGVRSGAEVCDNGSENRTYWPSVPPEGACGEGCNLALEWCGDATQNGEESCDNGLNADAHYHDQGTPPADACAPGCLPVDYCSDGLVNGPGEDCDEGGEAATCDVDCSAVVCGDGTVNAAAGEVCDDGNVEDADNCSADCLFVQRRVFVSSSDFQGDMNFAVDNDAKLLGIALADARCQQLAVGAGLAGNYKAWLSDDRTSPAQRFDTRFARRYRLLSAANNVIATGWADLTDGNLAHPIAADQTGVPPKTPNVWTNTLPDGTPASNADHWACRPRPDPRRPSHRSEHSLRPAGHRTMALGEQGERRRSPMIKLRPWKGTKNEFEADIIVNGPNGRTLRKRVKAPVTGKSNVERWARAVEQAWTRACDAGRCP